jgi:hypothetical protein
MFDGLLPGVRRWPSLNTFSVHLMPRTFATVIVAPRRRPRPVTSRGALGPASDAVPDRCRCRDPSASPVTLSPPIGIRGVQYTTISFTV